MRYSRLIREAAANALSWWIEGLWLGLPEAWRRRWFPPRPRLVVRVTGDELRGEYRPADDGNGIVEFDIEDADQVPAIRGPRPDTTLLLDRSEALTKTFGFPLAAERELRQLLLHEIERVSPFSQDEVVFDYEVVHRDPSAGRLRVVVGLVSTERLERVLDRIRLAGIRPDRATTSDAAGRALAIDWLGAPAAIRLPFVSFPMRPAVAGIACIALLAALYAPLARYQRIEQAVQASADETRALALELGGQTAAHERARSRAVYFREISEAYVSPLSILEDLTVALPESAWVSRLDVAEGSVQLQGEASGASSLLATISEMKSLDGAEFQNPVSLNESTRHESFSITATVAPTAAPEERG